MHSVNNQFKRPITNRDVMKIAKERDVRLVRLVFADIFGTNKNVSIPAGELERALDGQVSFDGGSIDGFVRGEELDMLLVPDPATFAVYPWSAEGTEARLICDITMPDGTPFEGCPRTTLQRVVEATAPVLPPLRVAVEAEFYLFEASTDGLSTRTTDVGSYFDFSANDRGEQARTAFVAALEGMGIGVASAHHEHGTGQHEIDLPHGSVLDAADSVLTLRSVVKNLATRFGLEATFMPKPRADQAGSGLHLDFVLGTVESPASDLNDAMLYAVGGLLSHAPATTAICNPTVNSYKRLVAEWDAPIYAVWAQRSANALVRVPPAQAPLRVEMRGPDASCNPYLALAVLLGAAADGVARGLLPGEPFEGTTYELGPKERHERGIAALPKSLRQAIGELDADAVVRGALGDHIYHAFRDAKLAEYERFRRAVHPWEHEMYLRSS
ncbi:MAG: glutamine synthetase [Candidatus Eremiobacteraeota bacterium]|nr:glutamine synthetase [Candidatus Eremiobacteraeota bacterium]